MDDEITECPLENRSEGACASQSPAIIQNIGNINTAEDNATSALEHRCSRVGVRPDDVPIMGYSRAGRKDQSQGAHAENRSHRSAAKPFFCCGSELSLVSLIDGVDLNSNTGRRMMCNGKQSLSDWENHLLPHSYSCSANLATASGAQTIYTSGKNSSSTLQRRVKRDEHKTKKRFWSLSFRKKLPASVQKSGSKKGSAVQESTCSLTCEKGRTCPCLKVIRRQAERMIPIPLSGNEELLAGERTGRQSRTYAECHLESLMRLNSGDDSSLLHLTSPCQSNSFSQQYGQCFHSAFVAEELVEALIHTRIDFVHHLVPDLKKITSCSFYWGVIDRYEAERLLDKKREGTFLLRDSAQDDFLFSVSFRRYNRSLHARIEQWNHRFSFDVHDPAVYSADSVCGLIEHYKDSSRCLFFEPMLTDPLHRTFPFTLQHLARAAICNCLKRYDHISKLPLPMAMKAYLRYYHYKQKVCIRRFDETSA